MGKTYIKISIEKSSFQFYIGVVFSRTLILFDFVSIFIFLDRFSFNQCMIISDALQNKSRIPTPTGQSALTTCLSSSMGMKR